MVFALYVAQRSICILLEYAIEWVRFGITINIPVYSLQTKTKTKQAKKERKKKHTNKQTNKKQQQQQRLYASNIYQRYDTLKYLRYF